MLTSAEYYLYQERANTTRKTFLIGYFGTVLFSVLSAQFDAFLLTVVQ